jgi:hypothetical protein
VGLDARDAEHRQPTNGTKLLLSFFFETKIKNAGGKYAG